VAVGALVGAVFGMAAGAMGLTIYGISAGLMWAVGAALGGLMEALVPSISAPSMTYTIDPIRNPMAQLIPIPVVYGKVRVGGNIFFQQFEDETKKIVYEHVALSEGPIVACNTSDVMVNDYTTADLDTLSKEVFLGTATQAAATWEPESLTYPYLAYVALRMEASSKLSGNPVVTAVIQGRNIEFPLKDETPLSYIGADATASNGFEHTDEFSVQFGTYDDPDIRKVVAGYKGSKSTCRCWGVEAGGTPSDDCKITFNSDVYANATDHAVVCFPLFFTIKTAVASSIDVYPDATSGTHYTIRLPRMDKSVVLSHADGVRAGWEVRKLIVTKEGTDDAEVHYSSGVMTVFIPSSMVTSGGKAKIVISCPEQPLNSHTFVAGGLLPYTDAETNEPPTFFAGGGQYDNPAWCIYDLLTNTRYGCGMPASWIDVDSFIAVAAQCDAEGIKLNYIVDTQKPIVDHLQEMMGVFRGWLSFRGTLKLGMDAPVLAPSKILTSDDIIEGSFSYSTVALDQIPNRIVLEYTDGEDDGDGSWEMVNLTRDDWDDIRARGVFERRISIRGITGKTQAKAMLNVLWESVHRCRTGFTLQTGLHNSDIEVGDVIGITYDLPNWTRKLFRVLKVSDEQSGVVTLAGIEYDEGVYDTSDDV